MQCVILAGGLGTRMWPEAKTVPKTLLPVAGKPFADWQLAWLAASGITSVVYCVGYLGRQIHDHVGDGSRWGLKVRYADEGDQFRGTASALRYACDQDLLEEDFLVLNGDTWLHVNPASALRAARQRPEPAQMAVFRNEGRLYPSNVTLEGDRVARYEKGLVGPQMRWVDCGLLAFRRDVITDRVPPGTPQDLAPLLGALASEGLLAAFETDRRFYEIGSPAGWRELEAVLTAREVS